MARGTGTALAPVRGGNEPLEFQLQGIDSTHPYLKQRGIWKETADKFGAGFYSGRGSLSGRVVIPIHNQFGALVAYAGRAIDDSEPKYKLPVGFSKSAELFNLHRIKPATRGGTIVIVEGFFGAMKVHQAGVRNVVALMGCTISQTQVELLARNFTQAFLLLDEDEAGFAGAGDAVMWLCHYMYVTTACLHGLKHNSPDELSEDEIQKVLGVVEDDAYPHPVRVK